MDVNGTRFHLLLGRHDWLGTATPGTALDDVAWNEDGHTLELAGLPFIFPPRRADSPPAADARRGAGRDRFGNWYWIDAAANGLLARAPRDAAPRPFWPVPDGPTVDADGEFAPATAAPSAEPRPLAGLTVTTEHWLVAGTLEPPGLLVFDLAAGGPPLAIGWPDGVPFAPADIAAAPDGGVWILDRVNARLWSLDGRFRVRAAALPAPPTPAQPEFEPETVPAPVPAEPLPAPLARPVTLAAALDVSAVREPVAVETLPDGSALLLGADESASAPALYRYTLEGADGVYRLAQQLGPHEQVRALLPRGHDVAFAGGMLYLVAPNGNQAFAFAVTGTGADLSFRFAQAFYPMRRFGGRAVVAAAGEAHYDSGDRWVSLLEQPRPRYHTEAVLTLPPAERFAFDGREPGCVWHRLFLDGCIPPGTSVVVESRAADSMDGLDNEAWQEEPKPHLRPRGAELPWHSSGPTQVAAGTGTWELLFQAAVGRYLQLRITLRGNGRTTPRLHALRAWYPRFSYLREYLPAVWREDAASASFVDRFLANVEGTFTEIEGRIAAAQVLLDTRTVPAEFLEWLAAWLGASLDAAWDEKRRRFFIANALRMFAGRGTRDGLVRALRLALEECTDPDLFEARPSARFGVRITESFLARSAPGVAWSDAGVTVAPVAAAPDRRWSPALGAEPLHARWRAWLAGRYRDVEALNDAWTSAFTSLDDRALRLAATQPAGAQGADWRRFLRTGLHFTYAIPGDADLGLWRDFLAGRHAHVTDLNRAWRRHGSARYASFEAVPFPAALPAAGAELADWVAFVSVVLPMRRGAHRFTVLVPVRLDDPPHVQRARRELAERVAVLEKPAHTVVESRLYWAAFQVGTARLGADSVLGPGSRFAALMLGDGILAGAHLGWTEPWNVHGRRVVGRDAVRLQPQALPARCS